MMRGAWLRVSPVTGRTNAHLLGSISITPSPTSCVIGIVCNQVKVFNRMIRVLSNALTVHGHAVGTIVRDAARGALLACVVTVDYAAARQT